MAESRDGMKTFLVLALAVITATAGDMLLSYGMRQVGAVERAHPRALLAVALRAARHPGITAGVFLLLVHFALFLVALSWVPVSLVVPATAATYVTTALLARWLLRERISPRRWQGIFCITLGVLLVAVG